MSASTDLWGEIAPTQMRTPLSILREQAALLGAKTKNLVEATVKTEVIGVSFQHKLDLVVPALDSYTYNHFVIRHGPAIYPVRVRDNTQTELKTEEQFVAWLGETLSSPETMRIVTNLLSQAAA